MRELSGFLARSNPDAKLPNLPSVHEACNSFNPRTGSDTCPVLDISKFLSLREGPRKKSHWELRRGKGVHTLLPSTNSFCETGYELSYALRPPSSCCAKLWMGWMSPIWTRRLNSSGAAPPPAPVSFSSTCGAASCAARWEQWWAALAKRNDIATSWTQITRHHVWRLQGS